MKNLSFLVAMVFILSCSVAAFAQPGPPVEPEGGTEVEDPASPADEELAIEKAAPADGEKIPEQIVVEEGGIAVVAPVTVNVPRQAPPVVNVTNSPVNKIQVPKKQTLELTSIPVDQFKDVLVQAESEKAWCKRKPGLCALTFVGSAVLVGTAVAVGGHYAGWWDSTTTVTSSR